MSNGGKEQWASRLGLVLAMAGNAIGLGNFLRFPRLAALYGGGAFMIPYFVALIFLGIPLMWVEWSMGRYGGQFGHTTTPGMFERLWKHPLAKYLGSLGITLPLLIVIYYNYIESWCLSYAIYSVTQPYAAEKGEEEALFAPPPISAGDLKKLIDKRPEAERGQAWTAANWTGSPDVFRKLDVNGNGELETTELEKVLNPLAKARTSEFLKEYQGISNLPPDQRKYFSSMAPALAFWIITVVMNCLILGSGIAAGIERLAKIAMPALFLFAVILMIRVMTYSSPTTAQHGDTVWTGLNFVWQPNFSQLSNFNVWLAAAGQIFFTLSVGTGSIQCYASYLKKNDDCALTGLTTAATNEFAEVVLGASIAIPIAVATFGLANTQVIAEQGTFNLGFVAMPVIFETLPGGTLFGMLWFALLFFAGITSSVALTQPFIAFMQEAFNVSRRAAVFIVGVILILFGAPVVLCLQFGYLDQIDFWAGTFGLAVFALAELLLFCWVFGGDAMWQELNRGADIRIPRIYYYIIRYVAPVYLMVLLVGWVWQNLADAILLTSADPVQKGYIWMARGSVITLVGLMMFLVFLAWHQKGARAMTGEQPS